VTIRHYPQEMPFKSHQDRYLPPFAGKPRPPESAPGMVGAGDSDSGRAISCRFAVARSRPGQSHLARLLPFSPPSFPRKRESSAPKPITRPWIPACAGMTAAERPENRNAIALGVSCCPRTLSCAPVWGACGTINLSSDDALDVLQISCRSRARPRQGFSRGWAEAHPHPDPFLSSVIPAEEVVKKLFGLAIRDSLFGN
jgi:hypothetical protein